MQISEPLQNRKICCPFLGVSAFFTMIVQMVSLHASSTAFQNGDDIKTVQGNLGHATAAFTLDVYGHVSERMKDDSARRMQAYINSIQETSGLGA